MTITLRHRVVLLLVLAVLTTMAAIPHTVVGATSTEEVIVVDAQHEASSDDNAGTEGEPLSTIGRALELAEVTNGDGQAVRVVVQPGVYRESLRLRPFSGQTDAPLVIEGSDVGAVVVDGADTWTDWTTSGIPGAYVHAWPHEWGLAPVPSGWSGVLEKHSDVLRRREVVWVDDAVMRQVLSTDELVPGTFHVDEDADELTLMPPTGVDPSAATVEVAVRGRALDVDGWSNVTVRGITFRRAATPLQDAGVRFIRTDNVLVEDVRSEWHNWAGLAVQYSSNVTIRRVDLTDNGVLGLVVFRGEDLDLVDVENSYNNTWRGPWADYYGWEAGSKVFRARGITFERWRAVGNEAYGLWLDTDITDVVVRDSFIAHNRRRGVFLEAMQGPVILENNTICNNRQEGVLDGKADHVTLVGNRIFDNGKAQVTFSGEPGGRSFITYDTGQEMLIRSTNWTVRDNVVEGRDDARAIGNTLNADDWEFVRDSLTATGNSYHHATDPRPFTISQAIVDLEGWKVDTGQDLDSIFSTEDAELVCQAPHPTSEDPPTDILDPRVLGGRAAVSDQVVSEVADVTGVAPVRLEGSDRYETAAAVVEDVFPGTAETVYLASGADFPDALVGAAVAGVVEAPVLLVESTSLPAATAEQLLRLQPEQVKVLGGQSAVSKHVLDAVLNVVDVNLRRLWGSDRYETAVAVVEDVFPGTAETVYLASGADFPDALVGAAVAGVVEAPVLLVAPTSLPPVTASGLQRLMDGSG